MNLEVSLVIGSFVTVLFFITGILIGWTAREYMKNLHRVYVSGPSNILADKRGEIIFFRRLLPILKPSGKGTGNMLCVR